MKKLISFLFPTKYHVVQHSTVGKYTIMEVRFFLCFSFVYEYIGEFDDVKSAQRYKRKLQKAKLKYGTL